MLCHSPPFWPSALHICPTKHILNALFVLQFLLSLLTLSLLVILFYISLKQRQLKKSGGRQERRLCVSRQYEKNIQISRFCFLDDFLISNDGVSCFSFSFFPVSGEFPAKREAIAKCCEWGRKIKALHFLQDERLFFCCAKKADSLCAQSRHGHRFPNLPITSNLLTRAARSHPSGRKKNDEKTVARL